MSQAPRILVIRSEPGASETADRLSAAGYLPVVEPVFAVEPIPADLPSFGALAFTSANGVRIFATLTAAREAPIFAVGARTAEAARAAGFTSVISANGDVSALASLIGRSLPPGAKILHAGNEESRGDLAGTLRRTGRQADFLAVYRAVPAPDPGPILASHIAGASTFDAVLVHSPRGAAILADFLARAAALRPIQVAAMSGAAASPLERFAKRLDVARSPNETELLAALGRLSLFG